MSVKCLYHLQSYYRLHKQNREWLNRSDSHRERQDEIMLTLWQISVLTSFRARSEKTQPHVCR